MTKNLEGFKEALSRVEDSSQLQYQILSESKRESEIRKCSESHFFRRIGIMDAAKIILSSREYLELDAYDSELDYK